MSTPSSPLWLIIVFFLTVETLRWSLLLDRQVDALSRVAERRGQVGVLCRNARRVVIIATTIALASAFIFVFLVFGLYAGKGGGYTYTAWALIVIQLAHLEFYKLTADSLGVSSDHWPYLSRKVLRAVLG